MSKGRERHQQHLDAVADLGRDLARRSGSRCELCGERGRLHAVEVKGGPAHPTIEWAILCCERCGESAAGHRRHDDEEMRFLTNAVWSETRPAQIAAVRITREYAERGVDWARECLDALYLDPEIEALI